jgi:hypothetical protein
MRLGVFHRQLLAWAERPCVLTVAVRTVAGTICVAGILRPYFSLQSIRGWALVPPQQHGGFETMRLTALAFDEAPLRAVLGTGDDRRLRYSLDGRTIFTLERDHAILTAPPRATRRGRYLYIGGRRRHVPEPWMLQ